MINKSVIITAPNALSDSLAVKSFKNKLLHKTSNLFHHSSPICIGLWGVFIDKKTKNGELPLVSINSIVLSVM